MAERNTPASPETTPKRKVGRPRKPDDSALIKLLIKRIDDLEASKQGPTLTAIPAASEELRPGSYFQQGVDSGGAPVMGKVNWTREWLSRVYGETTWVPKRTLRVGPMGIIFDLVADVEVTTPGICKQIHDDQIRDEKIEAAKFKPWSAAEDADLSARAMESPGTQQWSRLGKVGQGMNLGDGS